MGNKTAKLGEDKPNQNTVPKVLKTLEGHGDWVYALATLPGGLLASGSADKKIKIWDMTRWECVRTLEGHYGYVKALATLPGGQLASGSLDNNIKIWDNVYEAALSQEMPGVETSESETSARSKASTAIGAPKSSDNLKLEDSKLQLVYFEK